MSPMFTLPLPSRSASRLSPLGPSSSSSFSETKFWSGVAEVSMASRKSSMKPSRKSSMNCAAPASLSPTSGSVKPKTSPSSTSCSPSRKVSMPSISSSRLASGLSWLKSTANRSGGTWTNWFPGKVPFTARPPARSADRAPPMRMLPRNADSLGKYTGSVLVMAPVRLASTALRSWTAGRSTARAGWRRCR